MATTNPPSSVCPGCGLKLPHSDGQANKQLSVSFECQSLQHQLMFYSLSRGDAFFIHQVVVDAYGAQHAGPESKPIGVAFALAGLCLLLEHGCSGKDVQNAHIRLARKSKTWPTFKVPSFKGELTVQDVLKTPPGDERDEAIKQWAGSVWKAWKEEQPAVRLLLKQYGEPVE